MILVNFKIYRNSFGDKAVELAKICQKVAQETGVEIIPVVSALDVWRIKKEVGIKVYVQKVDQYSEGKWTGAISPIQAQLAGADGSLLNHSEAKIPLGQAAAIIKSAPKDFEIVLCVHSLGQAERWIKKLKPKTVAYEPSYLIESSDKSVSTEKPEVIKQININYGQIKLLVGAGVHSQNDVATAEKLGAKGVLVASDVVKSNDPEKELKELCRGFKGVQG